MVKKVVWLSPGQSVRREAMHVSLRANSPILVSVRMWREIVAKLLNIEHNEKRLYRSFTCERVYAANDLFCSR